MPDHHLWLNPEAEASLERLALAWGLNKSQTVQKALSLALKGDLK